MPPDCARDARARALTLIRCYGDEATSFQTLEAAYGYFFHGDDTCVAYFDTGGAWVAAGAPIGPEPQRVAAQSAFVAAARAAGKRAHFFASERPLQGLRSLSIGEQPVWDPQHWAGMVAGHRSLREQLRRARAKGVRVRRVTGSELESGPLREQVTHVIERWLSSRTLAPMGFLVQVEPFTFGSERCCFVAESGGRVVGFAGLIPIPRRSGWFLEDLLRDPKAPNGTSELLVDAAMRWASSDGCTWLTLGLAPLAGDVPRVLRRIRALSAPLYDFPGLRAYKAKLRPDRWQRVYLCSPDSALVALYDSLHAFASGSFLRFGLATLLRGPKIMARALAALLLPWTALLILAPAERWFGAHWVKWSWVCFDVLLAFGLFRLLRKPSLALLRVLALAVTADALVTTLEVAIWNLARVRSTWDYLALGIACLGPCLSAMVLWGASRHRLRFL